MKVIGWVGAHTSPYQETTFTNERRQALVECIRNRRYNFNYNDHISLPFCAPLYEDELLCILDRKQWDSVMNKAYFEIDYGPRLLPMDILEGSFRDPVLYEEKRGTENV